jgi:hypothetical protein
MRRGRMRSLVAVGVLVVSCLAARPAGADPSPCPDVAADPLSVGYPLPPGMAGAAGLVPSARYPGWGWMVLQHKPATLYAVHFPAAPGPHDLRAFRVLGTVKFDWGDLVVQDGKILIIESDQPWTRRMPGQIRVIYELPEPDLDGPSVLRPTASYRYAYPDGFRSNTEAAFSFAGHLVLVPKTTPARLYRFDQPLSPQGVNHPRYVGSLAGSDTVSIAAVSPDRTTLVVANHEMLFAYRVADRAQFLWQFAARPVLRRRIDHGDNVEAGGYFLTGRCKLILVAKSRAIYRIEPD